MSNQVLRSIPLPARQRQEVSKQAAATAAAVRRWDTALAACVGPSGDGDDADATCTHAAWEQLVDQVEIEMYYLLEHLRGMPPGTCHAALNAENDILRGFWHGAAPLDLAWLDEQQRPPTGSTSRPRSTSFGPFRDAFGTRRRLSARREPVRPSRPRSGVR